MREGIISLKGKGFRSEGKEKKKGLLLIVIVVVVGLLQCP